ncbi:hypothetical protein IJG14_06145 [bacterium]|nr:hypothetical protein [bacterium]
MLNLIFNYLKQPSTYAGIFTLLAAFGLTLSNELSTAISTLIIALVGLIEVIRKEKIDKENS